MGVLIFYIAIYFIGYYAAHWLNRMTGHILIRSRAASRDLFLSSQSAWVMGTR